jgi:lysophospholipase L1-like esterase
MSTDVGVLHFSVIGDSTAYGIGDLDNEDKPRGWAWYVAQNFLDQCRYQNYSRPGAQSEEVLQVQLPRAIGDEPDICAVIVGGNDLLRNGFHPEKLYQNLSSTCQELLSRGAEIVMVELHDPNQLLRLPTLLRRVLKRRVDAVNAVYRKIEREFDVIIISTRSIVDVHNKKNWHIDRMHPGPLGHQILAREICQQLQHRGWSVTLPELIDQPLEARSKRLIWLVRNGLPWFLKRSLDLLPAMIALMLLEASSIALNQIKPALPKELIKSD